METTSPYTVRQLHPEDAPLLVELRREALHADPLSFGATPEEDRGLSLEFVQTALGDVDQQAVFGCFDGEDLVGMVGVVRTARIKQRHKAVIWGMYVTERARGRGAGRALLDGVIGYAGRWSDVEALHLSVTMVAEAATRLYERAGFVRWGYEPRALQHDGVFTDEAHYLLTIDHKEI